MSEQELIDALERECNRVGLRPILELLVDWIGRGFFLEVFAQIQDEYPFSTQEERRAAANVSPVRS